MSNHVDCAAGGAIYTLGPIPSSKIQGNHIIHESNDVGGSSVCLYHDAGSGGWDDSANVCDGKFNHGYGFNISPKNGRFSCEGECPSWDSMVPANCSMLFHDNWLRTNGDIDNTSKSGCRHAHTYNNTVLQSSDGFPPAALAIIAAAGPRYSYWDATNKLKHTNTSKKGGSGDRPTRPASEERLVTPTDPHLYFSEQNWDVQHGGGGRGGAGAGAEVALAVNPGAYVKLSFLNSSSITLRLQPVEGQNASASLTARTGHRRHGRTGQQSIDASLLHASFHESQENIHNIRPPPPPTTVDGQYMNLIYSCDNGPYKIVPVSSNTSEIVLATNLGDVDASNPHTLVLYIYNALQINRWENPTDRGSALVVKGISLDATAVTVPPILRSKRAVFFGDSITEGCAAQCQPDPGCHVDKSQGDLCSNAATKTWGPAVAAALGAEFSQVGFGGLGWLCGGGGGVPPFYTPHNDSRSSWNKIWRGAMRNFSNVDYVFVLHATNDGIETQKGQNPAAVAASVHGWLTALRNAVGPSTEVFLTVPFGGFGAANRPVNALPQGFAAYQGNLTQNDTRTHFIDLGREAAIGLECWPWNVHYTPAYGSRCGPSFAGCAGIHPRGGTGGSARHGELGAMVAVRAAMAIASRREDTD